MNLRTTVARRWPAARTRIRHFVDQQIRLHQLYLDRNDVSGGDALDELRLRRRPIR